MSETPDTTRAAQITLSSRIPVVALSCRAPFCRRRCLHALLSHGTALFVAVVHLSTRLASLPDCTSPEACFNWRVPNTFLQFLLLSSTLLVCRAQLFLVLIPSVSPPCPRSLGFPSHCLQRPSNQSYLSPPRSSAYWPSAEIDKQSRLLFSGLFAKIMPSQ